jgi:hypothetical protein
LNIPLKEKSEPIGLIEGAFILRQNNTMKKAGKPDVSELMRSAKSEEYTGYKGLIFMLFQGKLYYSSEVIEIDPPFGEEYPIDA